MRARHQFAFLAVVVAAFGRCRCLGADDAAPPPADSNRRRLRSKKQHRRRPRRKRPRRRPPSPSSTPKEAHGVLGRDVRSPTDEDMGQIVDVIVDRAGAGARGRDRFRRLSRRRQPENRRRLERAAFRHRSPTRANSITLELTKEQVKAAPEYKEDQPIVVLGAAGSLNRCSSTPEQAGAICLFARSSRHPIDRIDGDRRAATGGDGDSSPPPEPEAGGPSPSRAELARPRLVHLFPCRRADRLRAVHRGLSDDAEMDAGRDRSRAVDRRSWSG